MPLIAFRHVAPTTLALLGLACVIALSPVSLQAEDPVLASVASETGAGLAAPQYPVSGRILTRERSDGRVELCFQPTGHGIICPSARLLRPERLRSDRWTRSSPIEWNVAIDPQQIVRPRTLSPLRTSCEPDFERMFAATWKVASIRGLGSAFHIGGGRFVTAQHVIEQAPPIVVLTHGDRSVVAAVLGSDREHDVALLEVFDPLQVLDVPSVAFRDPTVDDIGETVYLVGYPSAGALTAATGVVARVWEDEILTNTSSQGGNSGGPMFDSCGEVIGVIWAGSAARNFSHSGNTLRRTLEELAGPLPALPEVPGGFDIPHDAVVWHYGADPPADVDCAGTEGDWWVGVAGGSWNRIDWVEPYAGRCGYGDIAVIGFRKAPDIARDGVTCLQQHGPRDPVLTSILHESSEDFGDTVLGTLGALEWCPEHFTHELRVQLARPLTGKELRADLIGADGAVIRGGGRGTSWGSNLDSGAYTSLWQSWRAPDDFEPWAFRVVIGDQQHLVEIQPPDRGPEIAQRARIVVRADSRIGGVLACLQFENGDIACPSRIASQAGADPAGWRHSGAVIWSVAVDERIQPEAPSCALTSDLGDLAWQMTGLGEDGSALYVGDNQFITALHLFSDETPWGVVSQGDVSLPVARVATDLRNGLALAEVIGDDAALRDHTPPVFAERTEEAEESRPVLVAYPWGESDRFAMTRLEVENVTERLFWHDGWGWDRSGAPIVDPCTRHVIGVSRGNHTALRSETAVAAISELRRQRTPLPAPEAGPRLRGSIALLDSPIYLSTEQPDFGGWICNVRSSERYDVIYAVYLVSAASSQVTAVADGRRVSISKCGWSGKVFIVEYRSDEVPQLLCAEPWSPRSPRTTIDLSPSLPDGVELVQAIEFVRKPCPGLRGNAENWASTHYVRLRFTGDVDHSKLSVKLVDADGEEHSGIRQGSDVDPDVRAWRFNLGDATASRLIVSGDGLGGARSSPTSGDDSDSATTCSENRGRDGNGLVAETLHRSQISVGEVSLVRYGAPIRCPWRHTHGVVLEFTEQVSRDTYWHAALIGIEGQVLEGHWAGTAYSTDPADEFYTRYRHAFEVPEDFEVIAAEIGLGSRRWIVLVGDD